MELSNFPMKSQRTEDPTQANREYDCVATSIAACIQFLTGQSTTGSQLKNSIYGASYIGATYVSDYVAEVAKHGVVLHTIDGEMSTLLPRIRAELAQGHPVVAAELDPYVNAALDWTHMIAFYGCTPTTLTAMDPYIAQPVTKSDADWLKVLKYNEVWPLSKQEPALVEHVPTGWKDDGTTLTAPNGNPVVKGFRSYILTHGWDSDDLPLEAEQSVSQLEVGNPGLGGGSRQRFRRTTLEWNPTHAVFEAWTGQELIALEQLGRQLTKERDTLKAQLQQENVTCDVLKAQVQQLGRQLQQAQATSAPATGA
ncbi:hypothetical protein [Dictyobacter formicarum]|uniref:Peptidase C39-like domain-containing protein n=1 Tax=Dictyobacter formicarum TaxID=2778368 RepID=A0ABQ3VJL6_9CHLR|nr:hypothetical protein [Dictyobacter formicarum]GHO85793.1 hypothetical protein KSZ_37990 [Dictyobacter formicarum]